MAAYEALNNQQLYKAFGSVHRRINNLESRYGGVIGPKGGDLGEQLASGFYNRKQKLLAEKQGIRKEINSRMDAGTWDI
jgi:hypothetical protein